MSDDARTLLRHTVATLAYRGGKAVRGAPQGFAGFSPGPASRTPAQILAHVGDLLAWALSLARREEAWSNAAPLPWDREVAGSSRGSAPSTSSWPRRSPSRARPRGCSRVRSPMP